MSLSDLTDDLPARLLREERAGWEALREGRGAAHYGRKMTTDGAMIVPGAVLDRQQTVESLRDSGWDDFELHEPRLVRLGDHAGVLVYRAVATRGDVRYEAWMSTTYLWQDGGWKVAAHQQTPV
ncbi:DUF4440 domain-containing protein [Lysobacter korlensis]|uniref:DUF4440 domain-containing protein n=1 Tax=Lysobacter korlensis TaxID=553636 RepID=A0ABV6RTZ5_9GAMM